MFRMSYDAVDFFSADFTAAGVIVAGEEYPLGYFAAEALEVSGQLTLDIGAFNCPLIRLKRFCNCFLSFSERGVAFW